MYRVMTIAQATVDVTENQAAVCPPPDDSLRWIDLQHQDGPQLNVMEQAFNFHPLTIEDCLHFDQRPKLETYNGYFFLVIQGFHIDWEQIGDAQALELHLFIGKNFLISVHEHPIPALDAVWARVAKEGRLCGGHSDQLCYLIADSLIDSYFPLLDELQVRLDALEDRVLAPQHDVELEEIIDFKRLLIELRKIVSPQRDVLALLAKRSELLVSERVSLYFRDVYDHALRLHESVEAARELVANVRDAHLWNASQRTNEIMKRLTILSAIFLPLTFITGFFGQNFEALPFSSRSMMYFMLFSCLAVPAAMLLYFVRGKWI